MNLRFDRNARKSPRSARWGTSARNFQDPKHIRHSGRSNYATAQLIFLFIALIMVIWAMHKAGQPRTWSWLGFPEQAEVEEQHSSNEPAAFENQSDAYEGSSAPLRINIEPPADDAPSQTEALRDSDTTSDSDAAGPDWNRDGDHRDLSPENGRGDGTSHEFGEFEIDAGQFDEVDRALWTDIFQRLESDKRSNWITLINALSRDRILQDPERQQLVQLEESIDELAQAHYVRRFENAMLHPSGSQERHEAHQRLLIAQQAWRQHAQPLFRSVLDSEPLSDDQRQWLHQWRDELGSIAMSEIQDRAPLGRPIEVPGWLILLDQVTHHSDAEIHERSVGDISIGQLLSQGDMFRGQVVSVAGRVVQVTAANAGANPFGVEQYHVVWLEPLAASTYPFCIYVLELPEQLEPLVGHERAPFNMQVTATGYFFKVRMYATQQGNAEAPMLLARTLQVREAPAQVAGATTPFNPTLWVVILLAASLVAVAVAMSVWKASRSKRRRPATAEQLSELRELESDESIKGPTERLAELARADMVDSELASSENGTR